ncbi:MAG: DUF3616 domain-containing protein [Opitutus sp.]|nr:DUF3616 domain-containing protein [Opitutus sp.]
MKPQLASGTAGMIVRCLPFVLSVVCAGAQSQPPAARAGVATEYTGSADASGAMALGPNFFVVGDDEDSTLRVYRRRGGGAPVMSVDLKGWSQLQAPGGKNKELDLEGAARLGDKIFWIGSHGNTREGKIAPNRRQLFATTITGSDGAFRIALAGRPYRRLVDDLAGAPQLREFKLGEAAAEGHAPKDEGGFNVEGLCATPDGHLLIGLRRPVPQGRALLIPLLNPEGVIRGERARIGSPIRLDLQGRGVRDLLLVDQEYFIIGGDYRAAGHPSQLYGWAGGTAPARWLLDLPHLNPEVLIGYPDTGKAELQVLSDDGQKPPVSTNRKKFRSLLINL